MQRSDTLHSPAKPATDAPLVFALSSGSPATLMDLRPDDLVSNQELVISTWAELSQSFHSWPPAPGPI